jgi:methylisocitrate lyase
MTAQHCYRPLQQQTKSHNLLESPPPGSLIGTKYPGQDQIPDERGIAMSAGARLWQALEEERPLQVVGTINAYSALLAERAGFKAIYLSGAGVANASFGLPDLAMTNLTDVCEDIRRISYATDVPLLVDADTGWGDAFVIGRTVREMIRAGAAGCHFEDQVAAKRCGHRPGKALVDTAEMMDRIKAAVDGRTDPKFVIMARTDAHAVEGQQAALDRGADMIFAEALTTVVEYRQFTSAIDVPVLANLTEFGKTPLFTKEEMAEAGVRLTLYPLSAFRAMAAAAERVYQTLRKDGTQKAIIDTMQTRSELYDVLGYHEYEQKLDELFADGGLTEKSGD